MSWHRPSILVERLQRLSDRVRLYCRITGFPTEPVAPASLWSHPTEGISIYDLHRIYKRNELAYVFETFSFETRNPPTEGSTLYL